MDSRVCAAVPEREAPPPELPGDSPRVPAESDHRVPDHAGGRRGPGAVAGAFPNDAARGRLTRGRVARAAMRSRSAPFTTLIAAAALACAAGAAVAKAPTPAGHSRLTFTESHPLGSADEVSRRV